MSVRPEAKTSTHNSQNHLTIRRNKHANMIDIPRKTENDAKYLVKEGAKQTTDWKKVTGHRRRKNGKTAK